MKNFYEATVIKPELKLGICVAFRPVHGPVTGMIKINGQTIFQDNESGQTHISSATELYCSVPLTEQLDISLQLVNRQHPDALELSISIDGFEVMPKYQHLSNLNTCYIDSNKVWQISIPNFYPWYHQITGQGWIA
jgi:hypothetical protein